MKMIKANTLAELYSKVYKIEGWPRVPTESRHKRVMSEYGIAVDYAANKYVATKGGK